MRILLINKYHRVHAGAERLYLDTAKMLEEAGHEVAYFAMHHPANLETPWQKYFADQAEYLEESVPLGKKLRMAADIIYNRTAKRRLEGLIREFRPDVAHLFNVYHQLSPSVIWALKKHRVPIVMTLCDYKLVSPNYNLFVRGKIWHHASGFRCIADACVKDSYAKSLVCAIEQWLHRAIGTYGKVDAYLGLSRFLIDTFRDFGFPYPIQLLPQPLYPFPSLDAPLAPIAGKTLLYFGRLSPEKGVATAIRAFAKIDDPEARFTIVGLGPDEARLKGLVSELGLEGRVSFPGPVYGEAMQSLIRSARAVLMPSEWYENTPYALLEAQAAGAVVIAARSGSLPDRIEDSVSGFLYEPGDADGCAEKMRMALSGLDTAAYVKMREAARQSIVPLRPEAYVSELQSLYSRLVSAKK